MAFSNCTLPSGLKVHPVYVSLMEEDSRVTQDRFWATVTPVGDHCHVHPCIDVDVLQPMLQGLHYGKQTGNELGRRERRQTTVVRKKEVKKEQERKEEWDSLAQ